jgi:integrase
MHSGLRVSEIAALQIRDVNLKNGNNYLFVRQGKRGKDRDVAIDAALANHLKEFIKNKELWSQTNGPDAFLFSGNKGRGITPTALTVSFSLAVNEARLRPEANPGERLSIHSARHSYAVLLYKRTGNNLRYVQRQLGHSDINMTALYADIDPEDNDRLANMILND